jgi:hypothetical protein
MMTGNLSDLARSIEEGMKATARLIALREQRRADPDYEGCDFCFGTAIGRIGTDDTVPCPEHNGLCCG